MSGLSLSQAAKAVGRSKSTIGRALKSGRLSGVQNEDGTFNIEPAELFRAFPQGGPDTGRYGDNETLRNPHSGTSGTAAERAEINALRAELEAERALRAAAELLAEDRGRHIDDLRRMLPPPAAQTENSSRPWWRKIF